jgi:hypothetical protein
MQFRGVSYTLGIAVEEGEKVMSLQFLEKVMSRRILVRPQEILMTGLEPSTMAQLKVRPLSVKDMRHLEIIGLKLFLYINADKEFVKQAGIGVFWMTTLTHAFHLEAWVGESERLLNAAVIKVYIPLMEMTKVI